MRDRLQLCGNTSGAVLAEGSHPFGAAGALRKDSIAAFTDGCGDRSGHGLARQRRELVRQGLRLRILDVDPHG